MPLAGGPWQELLQTDIVGLNVNKTVNSEQNVASFSVSPTLRPARFLAA